MSTGRNGIVLRGVVFTAGITVTARAAPASDSLTTCKAAYKREARDAADSVCLKGMRDAPCPAASLSAETRWSPIACESAAQPTARSTHTMTCFRTSTCSIRMLSSCGLRRQLPDALPRPVELKQGWGRFQCSLVVLRGHAEHTFHNSIGE